MFDFRRRMQRHTARLMAGPGCDNSGSHDDRGSPPYGACSGLGRVLEPLRAAPATFSWREALAAQTAHRRFMVTFKQGA